MHRIGVLALAAAFAAAPTALAGSDHHSTGKLKHFSYDNQTKVGHLKLHHNDKDKTYRITKHTVCGEHRGESGDPIPCKSLGKDKYHGHSVQVTWHTGKSGARVASLASVSAD